MIGNDPMPDRLRFVVSPQSDSAPKEAAVMKNIWTTLAPV
jgi:hypothetical protein